MTKPWDMVATKTDVFLACVNTGMTFRTRQLRTLTPLCIAQIKARMTGNLQNSGPGKATERSTIFCHSFPKKGPEPWAGNDDPKLLQSVNGTAVVELRTRELIK